MNKTFPTLSAITLFMVPSVASAATFRNPLGSIVDPMDIVFNIIEFLLALAAPLALLGIVYGGVLLVVGGFDNEQQAARAKKIITWAIIGLAVVILSYVILRVLTGTILRIPG